MVKEIIPDDRKDDIAYLEAMLQEVAKCLANKVYEDWKRTNRLIRKDIAMVVTPMDIVGYYKNIIEARTEDTIKETVLKSKEKIRSGTIECARKRKDVEIAGS